MLAADVEPSHYGLMISARVVHFGWPFALHFSKSQALVQQLWAACQYAVGATMNFASLPAGRAGSGSC